jgi:hypothetical protein
MIASRCHAIASGSPTAKTPASIPRSTSAARTRAIVHLRAHTGGERLGAGAEPPRLHPDERDVRARAVEKRLQEHPDTRRRVVDG